MNPRKDLSAEVADLWQKLDGAHGKKYWRTLEELAESDAFREVMRLEFPEQADTWPSALSRRQFLTLMGASLALAGLGGCSVRPAPTRSIVPYVRAPEEIIPGRPLFYATAMTLGGCGVGLLVESHMGRPTKVEGNPDHPASGGATDLFHQASVLELYDPDRSQTVTYLGQTSTWNEALTALRQELRKKQERKGAGLRILTETIVSPTLIHQFREFLEAFPEAQWHQYEPLARDYARRAAVDAFWEEPVNTFFDFKRADVIVSFDADFLAYGPGHLRYAADFAARRRVHDADDSKAASMNRLYVIESMVTNTGAKADHRLAVKPSLIDMIARALAAELKVFDDAVAPELDAATRKWVRAVADDLLFSNGKKRPPGTTLVLAGDDQAPFMHRLAHAINQHLGNVGTTVIHTAPIETKLAAQNGTGRAIDNLAIFERREALEQLAEEMDAGKVEMLLILGGNPVFYAPADFDFSERMEKVPLRVHLGLFQDETSQLCHWHLPEAHFLEAWSDTRAYDGTVSIAQPLIEPLYQGRSIHEVLAALTPVKSEDDSTGYIWHELPGLDIVKGHWRSQRQSKDFEDFWQKTVHDGVMANSAYKHETFKWDQGDKKSLKEYLAKPDRPATVRGYELLLKPDPTIYDGRFANNGWLQELPKPITELTWDNAALMSPATAKALGIELGGSAHGGEHGGFKQPVMELVLEDRKLRAPAWIVPGHADGCITLHLGYGRESAGRVGGQDDKLVGVNAYQLRTSKYLSAAPAMTVQRTKDTHLLACTQQHQMMENRELVRAGTLGEYQKEPSFAKGKEKQEEREAPRQARKPLSLYESPPNAEHNKWGMVIDLTACTGCKACVVACQAENNIPVVGKEQVAFGREMHWLRIDHYFAGPFEAPTEFHFQPVPCMHCEKAPCEYVCPVHATVHSADGLNDMIYQRCVGTRFFSNNCPYKVRRFNFLQYSDFTTPSTRQQFNPDVTVRSRGVMEKCTYCVQRIRHAQIDSQIDGRAIVDGEVLTACQSACPAQAIIFGDLNDPSSKVAKLKQSPLNYGLLEDLNTQPRTTYLAAVRNPNPALEDD